jgi:hypothetical protein
MPQALEDLDRRRLSRTVWSEQSDDLALADGKADASDRSSWPVGLLEALDDNCVAHFRRITMSAAASTP